MKLIDIANKIDKSKKNECYINVSNFTYNLNYDRFDYDEFDYDNESNQRLKAYWFGNWHCTDSYVGYKMYFLDNEPVAVSTQNGRKSDEEFEWFSEELAIKVKNYLISLMPKKREVNITLCDINDDIGDGYKIHYNGQLLPKYNKPIFNGESVKILEEMKNKPYGTDDRLKIKLNSGEEKEIGISDLDFKFYVND